MARSFLREGTWGKIFSAVDGFFILSPTAHFSQRQFPFSLRRVIFCFYLQKVTRQRQEKKNYWEKYAAGDTFSIQSPAISQKSPAGGKKPTKKQAGDPHPPVSHKLAQLNSLAMEIS